MAAYHLAWDLSFFGLSATDPTRDPGWRIFGHVVAATFLILSGLGLVLAEEAGQTAMRALGRLFRIAAVAAGITGVSFVLAPSSPITFGILHCIVATNALALPLRRSRPGLLVGLAIVSASLPLVLSGTLPSTRDWSWVGLSRDVPATLDYRPFFPWFAAVLTGVALARTDALRTRSWLRCSPSLLSGMRIVGRHSLAFYVAHQPIMLVLLAGTLWLRDSTLR